jgi:hypothetical protein
VEACPTKETASTRGCPRIAFTASRSPWTRLTTPGGTAPVASRSSTIRSAGRGSRSEGLSRNELPLAIPSPKVELPDLSEWAMTALDYASTGLSTREHFLGSMKGDQWTGWSAFFVDGLIWASDSSTGLYVLHYDNDPVPEGITLPASE